MPIFSKQCLACGILFESRKANRIYCSRPCARSVLSPQRRKRVTLTCKKCGKDFETKEYLKDVSNYCSKACWSIRRVPNIKTCRGCNKEFDAIEKRQIYCTQQCRALHMVGKNAAAYKHGLAKGERALYSAKLTEWRKKVYHRDGYQCTQCGKKGNIQAHHIKEWAKYPEHRFDVDNGITLCEVCHGAVHGKVFTGTRNKKCPECGKVTKGRGVGGRCASCAIRDDHAKKRLLK